MTPLISTIIPVLNDDIALRRCLTALQQCALFSNCEVIVADGGASATVEHICKQFSAKYISSAPGRGAQMNRAAALALGGWLWFLHADSIPHPECLEAIANLDGCAVWGCFRHRINSPQIGLRVIECADNLRARLFTLPYGDQGIFVRAETFRGIGGFVEVPLLEDVKLSQRLGRESSPRVLHPVMVTDARRWRMNGVLRTTLLNWRIMFAFLFLGKTPEELKVLYRRPGATALDKLREDRDQQ